MKRFIIGLVAAATLALPVGAALADPPPGGPPGQGACDVGNSDNTCVPDPNENGQDCEEHGPNEGGVNENHCITTTVTTTTVVIPCEETQTCPTTTTTTVTEPTEPPTTTVTEPTSPPVTSPTEATSTSTETTASSTTDAPSVPTDDSPNGGNSKPGKLAFTGVEDVVPIGAAALALLSGGSYLLWRGRKRDDE